MKRVALLLVLALALLQCGKAKINPNDSSPPLVEIKVQQGNSYEPASEADQHFGNPVDLMGIVSDDDGVKSIELKFVGSTSDSCTVGSSVYTGNFFIALPAPISQTLQGDDEGNVLTKLPLLTTFGDPECKLSNGTKGRPLGHNVTAQVTGKNWSSNPQTGSTTVELKIHIK